MTKRTTEQEMGARVVSRALYKLAQRRELPKFHEDATPVLREACEASAQMALVASTRTRAVLAEVETERERQRVKWGRWEGDHVDCDEDAYALLVSASRAKDACNVAAARSSVGSEGGVTWAHILIEEVAEAIECAMTDDGGHELPALERELTQVAAVAVKWIEALRQRRAQEGGGR